MTKQTPSTYQRAIFDRVDLMDEQKIQGATAVKAVAGSGKTWTLVESMKRMTGKAGFFAFNKAIATELATRVPRHVTVRTINSFGFSTLRRTFRGMDVHNPPEGKLRTIIEMAMGEESEDAQARRAAAEVTRLSKLTMIDDTDAQQVRDLIDRYEIDCGGEEDWICEILPEILGACLQSTATCDFDDQLWMPVKLGLKPERYDWIGVDEAQDLSNVQRALIFGNHTGRILSVGDPRQSIYGFAGADCDSFMKIIRDTNAVELPLSICYRCPISHVVLAQAIVPEIQAAPGAVDGNVVNLHRDQLSHHVQDGDLVLCRCTAPLVELCLDLIRAGRKATLKGRDIGANLVSLVRRIRKHDGSMPSFLATLTHYRDKEVAKLTAQDKNSKAASLIDRVETLSALADGVQTVTDLVTKIGEIFSDTVQGITLSTIHRAKGLEATNVFLFRPDLVPHPCAKPGWESDQEMNLKYVALTRAKYLLGFVDDPDARERFEQRRRQLGL